jgi:hypothetical protein
MYFFVIILRNSNICSTKLYVVIFITIVLIINIFLALSSFTANKEDNRTSSGNYFHVTQNLFCKRDLINELCTLPKVIFSPLFIRIYDSTDISSRNTNLIYFPHDACSQFLEDYSIQILKHFRLNFCIFKFTHIFIML